MVVGFTFLTNLRAFSTASNSVSAILFVQDSAYAPDESCIVWPRAPERSPRDGRENFICDRVVSENWNDAFVVDSLCDSAPLDRRGVVRLARTGTSRCHRVLAGREPRTEGAAARPANAVE